MPPDNSKRSDAEGPTVRPDGLQLDEHRSFQERWWTVERFAWGGFCVLVAMAASGLLGGGGPLANARHDFEGGALEYPRVSRWQANDQMRVVFAADAPMKAVTLGDLASHFTIETVIPEPARTLTTDNGPRMEFAFDEGASGTVVFTVRAGSPGLARFSVAVGADAPVPLSSLVLP